MESAKLSNRTIDEVVLELKQHPGKDIFISRVYYTTNEPKSD